MGPEPSSRGRLAIPGTRGFLALPVTLGSVWRAWSVTRPAPCSSACPPAPDLSPTTAGEWIRGLPGVLSPRRPPGSAGTTPEGQSHRALSSLRSPRPLVPSGSVPCSDPDCRISREMLVPRTQCSPGGHTQEGTWGQEWLHPRNLGAAAGLVWRRWAGRSGGLWLRGPDVFSRSTQLSLPSNHPTPGLAPGASHASPPASCRPCSPLGAPGSTARCASTWGVTGRSTTCPKPRGDSPACRPGPRAMLFPEGKSRLSGLTRGRTQS